MKKLLILVLLFGSCSAAPDIVSQAWVDSVYNQGWYWPDISGNPAPGDPPKVSNTPVPFTSTGSFMAGFCPSGMVRQDGMFTLDEVNEDNTYAYYRFTYKFNNENLTLYQGVFHGYLNDTTIPGIFWANLKVKNPPDSSATDADKRAWLVETYTKDNFGNSGHALGLKKRGRTTTGKSTTVENYIPNNSNAPTSANTSGTINN